MANIRYEIHKNITRPSEELVARFGGIPVPNLGDCMNRVAAISSHLRPMNKAPLLGTAYTVSCEAGDNLLFYYAIDNAKPGDIIVVSGGNYLERALCGDIMAELAQAKKLGGFVVDGAVRDIKELSELDFPVYASAASPNGPYKNGPGSINVPVNIGGRVIYPGDILVGDETGVVSVRPFEAETVLEKAKAVMEKEAKMLSSIHATGTLDLEWMYQKLAADGCDIFEE